MITGQATDWTGISVSTEKARVVETSLETGVISIVPFSAGKQVLPNGGKATCAWACAQELCQLLFPCLEVCKSTALLQHNRFDKCGVSWQRSQKVC